MTLNDLERQKEGFMDFFGEFWLRDTGQKRIAPKSVEMEEDKLHIKFSALNVDFDGLSLHFLGSRKPAHESIKERYPRKSHYFTAVGQASLSWKRLHIGMGMLFITTSTSDKLFSRINIDDYERPWTFKIRDFINFCDLWLQRTLQEWIATKWMEIDCQFAKRNCYVLLRVSWALAQVLFYFLHNRFYRFHINVLYNFTFLPA